MKIKTTTEELNGALQILSNAISTKMNIRQVLSNLHISVGEDVIIQGTDLQVGIEVTLQKVEILEKGDALIPADRMFAICFELESGEVEIESTETEILIRTEN